MQGRTIFSYSGSH